VAGVLTTLGHARRARVAAAGYDAVIVGSGINSLVAGALLTKGGWTVCVLERNDRLGGAIRTDEITERGFVHEVFAGWHPQFVSSPAFAQLGDDLAARGVEYLNTDLPTATLYPDGESLVLSTSREANVAELNRHAPGDGDAWAGALEEFLAQRELTLGLVGTELRSRAGLALALAAYRRLGRRGVVEFVGQMLTSCRDWSTETFRSERAHGLFAPWVLHGGLSPDQPASAFAAKAIVFTKETLGSPVPRGGGRRLVDALAGIIRDAGGACEVGNDVDRVIVADGRATGVRTTAGEKVEASRAVLANVTPQQLYLRLLDGTPLPAATVAEARRFRFGRGGMQIHMALSEQPRWAGDPRLARTAIVHLTPGLDGVSRAANEADRGLLPAEASIVCGQPVAVDPSRAPEGCWIIWIQLQEVPSRPNGDAADEIDVGDGTWTESLRERYADRIQARLARQLTNLDSALLRRVVLSPADLEAANVNLTGGDMYSGSLALDQSLLFRPRAGLGGHRTPIARLFHIGASTHPGAGLRAGSGELVARSLLKRRRAPRH
jgi:phytoene dehydrogenase-like protein